MRRRIGDLRSKNDESQDFAVENLLQDRVDTYFKAEETLEEIDRMLGLIEEELELVQDFSTAVRLESRLEFIEDRFEELDSEIRQRPRRRRRKINFADFLRAAGGSGQVSGSRGEINNAVEAYHALGLEYGSSMAAVTAAFRKCAKKMHPDARKGDRSSEPELRRIIEAYQYLKDNVSMLQTEPPGNF
ncbi:DnaJ domain-containing protein [Nitrospiraceae bacterium AH_259_D15_M11_P09]|nr:DnaJ domain-containing protein [Nitrospiraceae bacterium AH_259_D15_M11_P09]